MSDYMFMLDSHLNGEQSKALAEVREAAEQSGLNLFLTGGAMRDMLGGYRIRDLDFTVEGDAVKFANSFAANSGAEILDVDDLRKSVELRFKGRVLGSIAMARHEKFAKPGSKPQVEPATIHEDLRRRDFTVNAIALSLGKASRGLLLDPANGLGDLSRRELQAVTNYALYDDPSRILRLIRLRARLGFAIEERTLSQYRHAREAKLETRIGAAALGTELRQIAFETNPGDILKSLEDEDLIFLYSPALKGSKLNLAAFQKLQKARQALSFSVLGETNLFSLFLFLLLEKLTPKERSQLVQAAGIQKTDYEAATRLPAKAAKIEKELATAKLQRPSALYNVLAKVPGETLLYLLMRSGQRLVIDRVKNYLQKYLPAAQEITEKDVIDRGAQPGTPKFEKLQQQLIAARLDARPKKVLIEAAPPPPPPPSGRRSASFG